MKKKYVLNSLIIMICLFIGGLVMLLSSTAIGERNGHNAMKANGGSMDTQKYYYIINSTSENFRTAGMVIALVGGFGLLMSGYGVYREI